jgi:hypothetical protein
MMRSACYTVFVCVVSGMNRMWMALALSYRPQRFESDRGFKFGWAFAVVHDVLEFFP